MKLTERLGNIVGSILPSGLLGGEERYTQEEARSDYHQALSGTGFKELDANQIHSKQEDNEEARKNRILDAIAQAALDQAWQDTLIDFAKKITAFAKDINHCQKEFDQFKDLKERENVQLAVQATKLEEMRKKVQDDIDEMRAKQLLNSDPNSDEYNILEERISRAEDKLRLIDHKITAIEQKTAENSQSIEQFQNKLNEAKTQLLEAQKSYNDAKSNPNVTPEELEELKQIAQNASEKMSQTSKQLHIDLENLSAENNSDQDLIKDTKNLLETLDDYNAKTSDLVISQEELKQFAQNAASTGNAAFALSIADLGFDYKGAHDQSGDTEKSFNSAQSMTLDLSLECRVALIDQLLQDPTNQELIDQYNDLVSKQKELEDNAMVCAAPVEYLYTSQKLVESPEYKSMLIAQSNLNNLTQEHNAATYMDMLIVEHEGEYHVMTDKGPQRVSDLSELDQQMFFEALEQQHAAGNAAITRDSPVFAAYKDYIDAQDLSEEKRDQINQIVKNVNFNAFVDQESLSPILENQEERMRYANIGAKDDTLDTQTSTLKNNTVTMMA